jgi:hypothetical protein
MEIKKFGIIISLFLFSVVTFISGGLGQVNAATSSTVLPVAKGGTGLNYFPPDQVLMGNGENTLIGKTVSNSVTSESDDILTSGGAYSKYGDVGNRIDIDLVAGSYLVAPVYTKKFHGFQLPDKTYFGYVEVDVTINLPGSRGFTNIVILHLPSGYALAQKFQQAGTIWRTGATSGEAWNLWSENDEINNSTALIRIWDNNKNIPRSESLRLLYNFPCIIKKV